ncbi:unnamed protein product, partial [Meganyctiphanes norvegica]
MTETQYTQGLNGDLQDHENISRESSDDEECARACEDAAIDPKPLNRCHDLDDMRSHSPGERRRSSIGEVGVPTGKKAPPRQWPPTSSTSQVTIPSKPLVRRGSLKGKVWPPPGYSESQNAQMASDAAGAKGRKGPPRQWPPLRRGSSSYSPPPMSPTLALISDDKRESSILDHSHVTDSQNNDSEVQSGELQYDRDDDDRACDISGDTDAQNSCHILEEEEDEATNREGHLLPPDSQMACRTPITMSPSPPATPDPRSDPSPSPTGSPRSESPIR